MGMTSDTNNPRTIRRTPPAMRMGFRYWIISWPTMLAVAPRRTKMTVNPATNASECSSVVLMFFLRESGPTSSSKLIPVI